MGRELHGKLQDAIGKLSDEQREVFLMRESARHALQKKSRTSWDVRRTAVKSRMRYALEKLREELVEYADLAKALRLWR